VVEVELDPLDAPATTDIAGDVADRDLLDGALRRLKPGHRAVVVLHFYLGMPLPDVAAAMGIPLGTAQSRLHYSMRTMRSSVVGEPVAAPAQVAGGHPA
jgi:RNA polymerase sigma-70 factor (ECF subfamily)